MQWFSCKFGDLKGVLLTAWYPLLHLDDLSERWNLYLIVEPRHEKTCLRECPTRSDSNRPAQLQKLAWGLKFWLHKLDITLSRQRTTKALIRLRGCAGWSAPLLFAYEIRRFLMAWLIYIILGIFLTIEIKLKTKQFLITVFEVMVKIKERRDAMSNVTVKLTSCNSKLLVQVDRMWQTVSQIFWFMRLWNMSCVWRLDKGLALEMLSHVFQYEWGK